MDNLGLPSPMSLRMEHYWDLVNGYTGTPLVSAVSGTGATGAAQAGEPGRPGLVRVNTGTTATGRAGAIAAATSLRLGGGPIVWEAAVRLNTIPDATQNYAFWVGLIDQVTAEAIDGCYVRTDQATGNWLGVCANNSARSNSGSLGAMAAATWVKFRAEINAAANSVQFFTNGTATGTPVTTNIPTATGRGTSIGFGVLKSAGTTARFVDVDYVHIFQSFTQQR